MKPFFSEVMANFSLYRLYLDQVAANISWHIDPLLGNGREINN
jgi:hypothetical protein